MESEFTRPIAVLWWAYMPCMGRLDFLPFDPNIRPQFVASVAGLDIQFSSPPVSSGTFGLLHAFLRGLAHLIEYAIFALLLYGLPGEKSRGLWRPRRAIFCIVVATVYSLTDEFHQLFVPGRHASLLDCGFDTIGAALAMLVPYAQEQMSFLKSNSAFSKG